MGPGSSSVWAEYSQLGVTGKNQNLFNGLGNQWYGTWETWNLEQPSMKTSKGFIHVGYNFIIYMEVSEIDIAKLFGSCQHILKWSYKVCGTFSSLIGIYINSKLYKQYNSAPIIRLFSVMNWMNLAWAILAKSNWSITLTWQHEVLTSTHSSVLIVNCSLVQNCRDCYIISNININRVDGSHQLDWNFSSLSIILIYYNFW